MLVTAVTLAGWTLYLAYGLEPGISAVEQDAPDPTRPAFVVSNETPVPLYNVMAICKPGDGSGGWARC